MFGPAIKLFTPIVILHLSLVLLFVAGPAYPVDQCGTQLAAEQLFFKSKRVSNDLLGTAERVFKANENLFEPTIAMSDEGFSIPALRFLPEKEGSAINQFAHFLKSALNVNLYYAPDGLGEGVYAGFLRRRPAIVAPADFPTNPEVTHVLIHEATHAIVNHDNQMGRVLPLRAVLKSSEPGESIWKPGLAYDERMGIDEVLAYAIEVEWLFQKSELAITKGAALGDTQITKNFVALRRAASMVRDLLLTLQNTVQKEREVLNRIPEPGADTLIFGYDTPSPGDGPFSSDFYEVYAQLSTSTFRDNFTLFMAKTPPPYDPHGLNFEKNINSLSEEKRSVRALLRAEISDHLSMREAWIEKSLDLYNVIATSFTPTDAHQFLLLRKKTAQAWNAILNPVENETREKLEYLLNRFI